MQDIRPRPGHAVEDDQPQALPRHVDAVPHRVGAEQAGIGLAAEDIDQRRRIERIDVLGPKRDPGIVDCAGNPLVDQSQPGDGGEETEGAAAGSDEKRAVSCRDLIRRASPHVGNDEHAGLRAVVEGGGERSADRRRLQVAPARRRLRRGPVLLLLAGAIAQRRRGDERAVGAAHDELCERDRGVHIVTVHADIDISPFDAGDREPIDESRGVGGAVLVLCQFVVVNRNGPHVFQHGAPGAEPLADPALDPAHDRLDPLALGALQTLGFLVEQRRERGRELAERPGDVGQR